MTTSQAEKNYCEEYTRTIDMTDDATTARRKAMAEAIKTKYQELYSRAAWPAGTVWDELSEAADVAAENQRKEVP